MKAVSYEGTHKMAVIDHPKPEIQAPTDALLRVTTSGICGSDLHMYDGRTPLEQGTVVGHEIMGAIEEVGNAVKTSGRETAWFSRLTSPAGIASTVIADIPKLA